MNITSIQLHFHAGRTELRAYTPRAAQGYVVTDFVENTSPKAKTIEGLRAYGAKRAKAFKVPFSDHTV